MKAELFYQIQIEVSFTNNEVKLITKALLRSEYSWEVTDKEGFWNIYARVHKYFRGTKTDYYRTLTFRELDKITKAFEPWTNGWIKDDEAVKLSYKIRNLLRSVNKVTEHTVHPKKIKI